MLTPLIANSILQPSQLPSDEPSMLPSDEPSVLPSDEVSMQLQITSGSGNFHLVQLKLTPATCDCFEHCSTALIVAKWRGEYWPILVAPGISLICNFISNNVDCKFYLTAIPTTERRAKYAAFGRAVGPSIWWGMNGSANCVIYSPSRHLTSFVFVFPNSLRTNRQCWYVYSHTTDKSLLIS